MFILQIKTGNYSQIRQYINMVGLEGCCFFQNFIFMCYFKIRKGKYLESTY